MELASGSEKLAKSAETGESRASVKSAVSDHWFSAGLLALCAFAVGGAISVGFGMLDYDMIGIYWLAAALAAGIAAIALWRVSLFERFGPLVIVGFVVILLIFQTILTFYYPFCYHLKPRTDDLLEAFAYLAEGCGAVAILAALAPGRYRLASVLLLLSMAWVTSAWEIRHAPDPSIDVYFVQQSACDALAHGKDPFDTWVKDIYNGDPRYVSKGASVNGWIHSGYPYMPLSLLMAMPGYLLAGDVRYADLAALIVAGALIALGRPGRLAAGAAALLLTTPKITFVIESSWTEPLSVVLLAAAVFCAVRWRPGVPWLLGLLIVSKQDMIVLAPLTLLLLPRPWKWKAFFVWSAQILAAALIATAPMILLMDWKAGGFVKISLPTTNLQAMHRTDALSLVTWFYHVTRVWLPDFTAPAAALAAIGLALWRCARTPAGFAAAAGLTHLAMFCLSKHAFCNHYFFVIAAMCIALAAMELPAGNFALNPRKPG